MRSDRRFKDCRDTARLVRGVATMGASLVRSGLFVVALIAICLGLARLALRTSPETELFVFWLLCVALSWAGSPWLLVAAGI